MTHVDDGEAAVARYGTEIAPASGRALRSGELVLRLAGGAARAITIDGVEVIRGIDYPIRDADWATLADRTLNERVEERPDGFLYEREFEAGDDFRGRFTLTAGAGTATETIRAEIRLEALRDARVNRAGFVVLHPLRGVVGRPLRVRRPDGSVEDTAFPTLISPGQPVFDISGLSHDVCGVAVDIAFSGDVFEMEDQRNWTDASFKTYCRPLSRPRPFDVAAGEVIAQVIEVSLQRRPGDGADVTRAQPSRRGHVPEMTVALDETVAPLDGAAAAIVRDVGFAAAQVRIVGDARSALGPAATLELPIMLEVVIPAEADPARELKEVAAACVELGLEPVRVLALPQPYLASHQPEGPWPEGPSPEDAARVARATFPSAKIGVGMLTNFTELNRRPPREAGDYLSFGTTAIVHAADDASVLETLEALPDVFQSAAALAAGQPIRLGLVSIGMRSNPYGSSVAPNPALGRVAMAQADPRQRGLFAAAFLVGVAAAAAVAGVKSLSPAMPNGPLGLVDEGGSVHPLFHVVRALATLAGDEVEVDGQPGTLVVLRASGGRHISAIAANLGDEPVQFGGEGRIVAMHAARFAAARDPRWLDVAEPVAGRVTLQPLEVAFLFGEGGR